MTKKMVTAVFTVLYDCSIKTLLEYVDEATRAGYTDLGISCEDMSERYDSQPRYNAVLSGKRLETDKEYENRLKSEANFKASQEAYEKAQYEALKKKFEGKP